MARVLVGSAFVSMLLSAALPAFSQTEPTAPATYPDLGPRSGALDATSSTPTAGGPAAAAPAAPLPTPSNQAPASGPPAAAPGMAAAAPTETNAPRPASAPYATTPDGTRTEIAEPPLPPPEEEKAFALPDMSVRVDPLKWLIYGRLGIELEASVWRFISAEVVPVFVTDSQPPFMNLGSFPEEVYQASNGLGAMSGASFGVGFWLNGKPFVGTVLRFYYTNYGYRYTSKMDNGSVIDEASHTERHLVGFLGSHSKWGPFTIASGIGLGVEMNRERRCLVKVTADTTAPSTDCNKDVFQLARPDNRAFDVYDSLHPVYLTFRLSLGFVF